jgi:cytidylate kinase
MNTPHLMTNSDADNLAAWRDSHPPWIKPAAPFITLSRECCSGGSALAQILAGKLTAEGPVGSHWGIFGGNVVSEMLHANHLPPDLARFLPEDRVPEVSATIGEIVGRHPSLWDLVQKTKQTMRRIAREGHVIFVGRGANFATAGLAGGVHVRLVAPADHRGRFYAQRFGVTPEAAVAHNARCDAARRRYVATHFSADVSDPAAYDLVINTAHVPLAEAADMILAHLRAVHPAAA